MLKKLIQYPYLFLILFGLAFPLAASHADDAKPATQELTISTADGDVIFTVEMARTDREQEQGLMYRTHLDDKYGMLFDFGKARPVTMWMKNTLIPLDMIFIDEHGIISQIAAKAVPESTDLINAKIETRAVLEVAGGTAQKYRISVNDKVRTKDFP